MKILLHSRLILYWHIVSIRVHSRFPINFTRLKKAMKRTFFTALALTLLGCLASLVMFEIAFRMLGHFSQPITAWIDRPPFYFQAEGATTVQDYLHSPQKPPNTFRIAIVGDSYTFAPYLQFTDAFPKVLERMLNLNQVSLHAEVINYGVPAYSTTHEVATLRRAIAEQADLVILQITLNDPEIKPYRPTGIPAFNEAGEIQLKGWKMRILAHWKSLAFVLKRIHNKNTQRDYQKYFIRLFENPKYWNNFVNAIKTIAEVGQKNKLALVAVVFPLFGLPLDENYPFHICHEKTVTLLSTLNIPYLDLYTPFKGIPLERIQVMPNIDRHPNEIAHRIAAEQIYIWLAKNTLIPEELKIRKRFKNRTRIIEEAVYVE